jgi:hypothetical protein
MGQGPVWRAGPIAVTIEDSLRAPRSKVAHARWAGTKEAARKAAS